MTALRRLGESWDTATDGLPLRELGGVSTRSGAVSASANPGRSPIGLAMSVSYDRLFPVMGNRDSSETPLVRTIIRELRATLPRGWSASWRPTARPGEADGVVTFLAPEGQNLSFLMQVKARYSGAVGTLVDQAVKRSEQIRLPALLAVEYANPALRHACEAAGVSFVDTTGWIWIDDTGPPGLVIRSQGAQRSPVIRPNVMSRLDGPGAGRVIRKLWEINAGFPIGVRDLAQQAGVAAGTVSKVLPALESYGAVTRDSAGRVSARDRRLLVQRWTQDYDFRRSNRRVGSFLAPRGLHVVNQKIQTIPKGFRISSTGPGAAAFLLADQDLIAVLPVTTAAYYAQDVDALAEIFGIVESPQPAAANVIIAEPRDLTDSDLLPAFGGGPSSVYSAPPVQVIADLATMGGRYPELAEQVLQALTLEPTP